MGTFGLGRREGPATLLLTRPRLVAATMVAKSSGVQAKKLAKKPTLADVVEVAEAVLLREPPKIPTYRQGDRCVVSGHNHGVVQFVGQIKDLGTGLWVGVQLDHPVGNTNGKIGGRVLFGCPPRHGGFYRASDLQPETSEKSDSKVAAVADTASSIAAPVKPVKRSPSLSAAEAEAPPPSKLKKAMQQVLQQNQEAAEAAAEEAEVDEPPWVPVASAQRSHCAGRGLHTAVVKQLAQFLITAFDCEGMRRVCGGDAFVVAVRGVSPPSNLRVKLHDHGNGSYTAEYRPEVSGQLVVTITLDGVAVAGSPFKVHAVTLRPESRQCVLRGDALQFAVARKPMTFEIDFVDGLGQVAVAEDVDVRLERFEPLPAEEVTAKRAKVEAQRPAARVAQRPGARVAARRMRAAARWQRNRVRRIRRSLCKMRTKTRSSRRGLRARGSCECSSAKG